jgi:hypothetical protein
MGKGRDQIFRNWFSCFLYSGHLARKCTHNGEMCLPWASSYAICVTNIYGIRWGSLLRTCLLNLVSVPFCPLLIQTLCKVLLKQVWSYTAADGQFASSSWSRDPICGLRSDLYYCWTFVGRPPWWEDMPVIYMYSSLSLSYPSPLEPMTASYCFVWNSPNLEGRLPVFISHRNSVAQIYPRTPGSLYVASYDSQRYSGDTLTRLHTGLF